MHPLIWEELSKASRAAMQKSNSFCAGVCPHDKHERSPEVQHTPHGNCVSRITLAQLLQACTCRVHPGARLKRGTPRSTFYRCFRAPSVRTRATQECPGAPSGTPGALLNSLFLWLDRSTQKKPLNSLWLARSTQEHPPNSLWQTGSPHLCFYFDLHMGPGMHYLKDFRKRTAM